MKYNIKARVKGSSVHVTLYAQDVLTAERRAEEIYGAGNVLQVIRSSHHDFGYRGRQTGDMGGKQNLQVA